MLLAICGALLALSVLDVKQIKRQDGSTVTVTKSPSWKSEISRFWKTLITDTYFLLLFPMFFTSA